MKKFVPLIVCLLAVAAVIMGQEPPMPPPTTPPSTTTTVDDPPPMTTPPAPPGWDIDLGKPFSSVCEEIDGGFVIENRGYVSAPMPPGSFHTHFVWSPMTNLGVNGATYFDNLVFFFAGQNGGGVPSETGSAEVAGPCYKVQFAGTKLYLQEVKPNGDSVILVEKTMAEWDFMPPGSFEIDIEVDIEAQTVKVWARKLGQTPEQEKQLLLDYQLPNSGGHLPFDYGAAGFYNREKVAGVTMTASIQDLLLEDLITGESLATPPAPEMMIPPPEAGGDDPPPPMTMPPGGY